MTQDAVTNTAATDAVAQLPVDVADAGEAIAYSERAAVSYASHVIPSEVALVVNLSWVDVRDGEAVPDADLSSMDLRWQEQAGVYWETPSRRALTELGVPVAAPVMVTAVVVVDALGNIVRTLGFRSVGQGRFVALWDGRDDAGYFVPAGDYACRIEAGVDCFRDQQTTEAPLSVRGDAYRVFVRFTPKADEDIRAAIDEASPQDRLWLDSSGRRLMRDCWVEVFRGGDPGSGDAVRVADPFQGHMEATAPGYFSTPKARYSGVYVAHKASRLGTGYWDAHSSVGLRRHGQLGQPNSEQLPIHLMQPATKLRAKSAVEVHRGHPLWTSFALSQGCPTIAAVADGSGAPTKVPYGDELIDTHGRGVLDAQSNAFIREFVPLANRQRIQVSDPSPAAASLQNAQNFVSSVFAGFTIRELRPRTRRVEIGVELMAPYPGSLYGQLHRTPLLITRGVAFDWLLGRASILTARCQVRVASSVMRRVSIPNAGSEDLVIKVDRSRFGFVAVLRYARGDLRLDHALTDSECETSIQGLNYELRIMCGQLPVELWGGMQEGGCVSLVLRPRFVWDWNSLPVGSDFAYLPPADANGRRWETVETEFEWPVPAPQVGAS